MFPNTLHVSYVQTLKKIFILGQIWRSHLKKKIEKKILKNDNNVFLQNEIALTEDYLEYMKRENKDSLKEKKDRAQKTWTSCLTCVRRNLRKIGGNDCNATKEPGNSQVSNASFTHGAGDGLHRRAQSVEQRRQLPGAFGFPPLLHHKAGHSDHVGVEGPSFGHGGRWSLQEPECRGWTEGCRT